MHAWVGVCLRPWTVQTAFEGGGQIELLYGLAEIGVSAEQRGGFHHRGILDARTNDDRQARMHPHEMLQGRQAPHPRHLEVEQYHVGLTAMPNAAEGLLPIPSRLDAESREFEDGLKVAQHQRRIIHHQNCPLAARRTLHVRRGVRRGRRGNTKLPGRFGACASLQPLGWHWVYAPRWDIVNRI